MDNITFKDKSLYNNNIVITEFESDIKEILIFSKQIIILLDRMNKSYGNENVFCVNGLGQIIWQVPKYEYEMSNPYNGIWKINDYRHKVILNQLENIKEFDKNFSTELKDDISELVWLHHWDGTYIIINVETGKVLIDPDRSMYGSKPW